MRLLFSLLSLVLLALATPCLAQTTYFACGVNGIPLIVLGGAPFMGFTPPEPNASQAVTITVGMVDYNPMSAVAVVQGNAITVTFRASYLGFTTPPALSCSTATVGPLPAGNYQVDLFLVDPGIPNQTPIRTAIGTLAVVSTPAPIPATSGAALVLLALLLSIAGSCVISRRQST